MTMLRDRRLIVAVVALLLLLGGGAYFVLGGGGAAAGDPKSLLALSAYDRTLGSADAPVTVVEYFAPSCPVCAYFDEQNFDQLKATYIDTGKVRYVMRTFLLRQADGAAEAMARCLPAEQYHDFIRVLFRAQNEWDPEFGVTDVHGALQRIGKRAGMTPERVDACIADKDMMAKINKVSEDARKVLDVHATPTLFINGDKERPGAMSWEDLKVTIDVKLLEAEAAKAK